MQLPLVHEVAFMFAGALVAQFVPHAPQFVRSLSVSLSQPSVGELLQSRHAPLHAPIWHTPAPSHDPVAFSYFVVQSFPQLPQLPLLVFVSTSQPSAYWQLPSEHPLAVVLFGGLTLQSVAQSPQCAGSVLRFASHPLLPSASQSPYPRSHVKSQLPAVQIAVALAGSLHTVVQLPHAATVFVGVSHPSDVSLLQSPQPPLQLPI